MSDIYPIAVPKWGIEMVEGTITTWNKSEGDAIAKGDEVFEMESDKIVNVWDSPVDGVLRRVLVPAGDAHPVGALLGVIADASVAESDIDAFIAEHSSVVAVDRDGPRRRPLPASPQPSRPHKPATLTPAHLPACADWQTSWVSTSALSPVPGAAAALPTRM